MLGRPVLMSIAATAISMLSVADASAGCMSCGCGSPVVYQYVSPCAAYASPPMYVVNQGPAYTLPVPIAAEPTPVYSYPYMGRGYRAAYGAVATYSEEADEAPLYPRAYRSYRGDYGYSRDFRFRHRSHMGARRLYDSYRRMAHVPRHMGMQHRMHMQMRMQMRMPMHRAPMPGVVHPQGKRGY